MPNHTPGERLKNTLAGLNPDGTPKGEDVKTFQWRELTGPMRGWFFRTDEQGELQFRTDQILRSIVLDDQAEAAGISREQLDLQWGRLGLSRQQIEGNMAISLANLAIAQENLQRAQKRDDFDQVKFWTNQAGDRRRETTQDKQWLAGLNQAATLAEKGNEAAESRLNRQLVARAEESRRSREATRETALEQRAFQRQESVAGRRFEAGEGALDRAQRAQAAATSAGLQREQLGLQRQQLRLGAAEQFANQQGVVDPIANRAFLAAGGGNIANALAMGETALSEAALTPAAMTLQATDPRFGGGDSQGRLGGAGAPAAAGGGGAGGDVVEDLLRKAGGVNMNFWMSANSIQRQIEAELQRNPNLAPEQQQQMRQTLAGLRNPQEYVQQLQQARQTQQVEAQEGFRLGALAEARQLRETTEVPDMNPFSTQFRFADPLSQQSFFKARQSRFGVPVASQAQEARRFGLRGVVGQGQRLGV